MIMTPMEIEQIPKENLYIGDKIDLDVTNAPAQSWTLSGEATFPSITGYSTLGAIVNSSSGQLVGFTAVNISGTTWKVNYYNKDSSAVTNRKLYCYPIYKRTN